MANFAIGKAGVATNAKLLAIQFLDGTDSSFMRRLSIWRLKPTNDVLIHLDSRDGVE